MTNDDIVNVLVSEHVAEFGGERWTLIAHCGKNVWQAVRDGAPLPAPVHLIYHEHPLFKRAGDPHMAPKGGRRGETVSGDVPGDKEAT